MSAQATPSPALMDAGAECVSELAGALLMAAGDTMKRHGNDPNGASIVAAGFAMALRMIGTNIDPIIPRVVSTMLRA